ncbi:MAG: autotransporter outer membrane beta-barrel domain-containing protein [Planctomycetes bacterium]|nr:autotransporter outer membrane beta-barrel domain-containing protein [Planctomycetota bacterium]
MIALCASFPVMAWAAEPAVSALPTFSNFGKNLVQSKSVVVLPSLTHSLSVGVATADRPGGDNVAAASDISEWLNGEAEKQRNARNNGQYLSIPVPATNASAAVMSGTQPINSSADSTAGAVPQRRLTQHSQPKARLNSPPRTMQQMDSAVIALDVFEHMLDSSATMRGVSASSNAAGRIIPAGPVAIPEYASRSAFPMLPSEWRRDREFSRWRTWAGYVGASFRRDGDAGYAGHTVDLHGAVVGSALALSSAATVGFQFSVATVRADAAASATRLKANAYAGGAFASLTPVESLRLDLDAAIGYFDNDFTRVDNGQYRSGYNQDAQGGGLRATYDLNLPKNAILSPFAGVRYQYLSQDKIDEYGIDPGADNPNSLDGFDGSSFTTTIGAALSRSFQFANGRALQPSVEASWRHEWAERNFISAGHIGENPAKLSVSSLKRNKSSVEFGFNLKALLIHGRHADLELEGGYKVKISKKTIKHDWYAGMVVRF